MHPGIVPWIADAWTGILLGGPDARIGGAAAGYLHGLFGPAPESAPGRIDVLVPLARHLESRGCWRFVREGARERSHSVGSPPRTRLEDTVLDLCAGRDEAATIDLLTRAVQTRRTSVGMLRRRLSQRTRIRNRRMLEAVLAEVDEGAESPLEVAYLRHVERAHDLPRGRRQVRSASSIRDVVYDDYRTLVELDGRLGHEDVGRFRDMARDNLATLTGAATLRFGWHDVAGEPCKVAMMVENLLRLRGWTGRPASCERCTPG